MHIVAQTPSQAVQLATETIRYTGTWTSPRGMKTMEVLNATIQIVEPWHLPLRLENRSLNYKIGVLEALQLVGQTSVPELMLKATSNFSHYMDHGVFHGAYGVRVHGNLARVVQQLQKDESSRQAVLTIFDSHRDLMADVRDVPCTLSLQFFLRDDKLQMRTVMRSNDVYLGMPYDFTQFIALQGAIAAALDVEMGMYTHSVGSLHVYETHLDKAVSVKALSHAPSYNSPLWSGKSIEEITFAARELLSGGIVPDPTGFEAHCELEMYELHGGE